MIQLNAILNSTDKQTSPPLAELAYKGTMGIPNTLRSSAHIHVSTAAASDNVCNYKHSGHF